MVSDTIRHGRVKQTNRAGRQLGHDRVGLEADPRSIEGCSSGSNIGELQVLVERVPKCDGCGLKHRYHDGTRKLRMSRQSDLQPVHELRRESPTLIAPKSEHPPVSPDDKRSVGIAVTKRTEEGFGVQP